MKVAICQASSMPMQEEILEGYLKYIENESIVVFGEYVFNPFFSDLKQESKKMITTQLSSQNISILQKLAERYRLKIIAPIITFDDKYRLYKQIVIIGSQSIDYYMQQRLINYEHWNEQSFFSNPRRKMLKTPYIFEHGGVRVGVLFGFEIHFDALWLKMQEKDVDIVLMPTASMSGSNERWQMLCQMRAFCGGMMVVRVNRTGRVMIEDEEIDFCGESFIVNPDAKIVEKMSKKEGIACFDFNADFIKKQASIWGFRKYNLKGISDGCKGY